MFAFEGMLSTGQKQGAAHQKGTSSSSPQPTTEMMWLMVASGLYCWKMPPVYLSRAIVALMPHEMGPRLWISACHASSMLESLSWHLDRDVMLASVTLETVDDAVTMHAMQLYEAGAQRGVHTFMAASPLSLPCSATVKRS